MFSRALRARREEDLFFYEGYTLFCLFPSGQDTKFHPHDDDADGDGDGEGGLRLSLSPGLSLSS